MKKIIENMVVVKPLKSHFSIEKELKSMQDSLDKAVLLQKILTSKNNPSFEIKTLEKPKNADASKILKDLKRKNRIAGLNSVGNSLQRNNLIKKIAYETTYLRVSGAFGALSDDFEELINSTTYLRVSGAFGAFADNVEDMVKWIEDVLSGRKNNVINKLSKVLFGEDVDAGFGTQINDGSGIYSKHVSVDAPIKNSKTPQIQSILKAGADFLKNFFEVSFVFRDRDAPERFDTLMFTRTGSIEIPRLKAKTFTVKTINGSVEKIASQLQGTYETTLDLRIDQDCYILDKFSEIGGIWQFNEPRVFPASSIFMNDSININRRHRLDIVVKEISGFEHRKIGLTGADKSEVNQFKGVYAHKLKSKYDTNKVNTPNVRLNETEISEWVLEDVRIVGISDINYSFDQTSPPNIQLQLTMKSVFHRTGTNYML